MHDRAVETGQQCGGPVGMDGIVVTGNLCEWPHVDRRGNRDVAATPSRGVSGILRHRSPGTHRIGQFERSGAATDGETLFQNRQNYTGTVVDVDGDRYHPADLGIDSHRSRCGDSQLGSLPRQGLEQTCGVIEVHQAQQALDDRKAVFGGRTADRGEHRGPATTDEGIGNRRQGRSQRSTEGRGHTGVVGNPFGIPVDSDGGGTAVEIGQGVRPVGGGGNGQYGTHRRGGIGGEHHRCPAVDHSGRQCVRDVDPGS